MSHSDGCEPPTDQFIGLTGLTVTREKSCNTVNTSHGIAALWWLLTPITCIYPHGVAVAVSDRMQNRTSVQTLRSRSICHCFEGLGGQNAGSSFFLSFFGVFTPDRGWSLSRCRSLDLCHRNWLHSPSSLRPVDTRVAAPLPIMKWPWSSVSRAIALLKQ